MKTLFLFITLFSFFQISLSQNLVPNPSFEDTASCPNGFNQINKASGWSAYRYSPDYFNKCSSNFNSSVPSNSFGTQYPSSVECTAYAGFISWGGGGYREHLGIELITQLTIGQKYYVSYKVNLADTGIYNCGTNKLGILFSTVAYNVSNSSPVNNFAHIYNDSIIIDKLNWINITGELIADSNYCYMAIGNFFDDLNTDTSILYGNGCGNYYFIDDICVSTDSALCNPYSFICNTGINFKYKDEKEINIYPNPSNTIITIEIKSDIESKMVELFIYDLLGNEVKKLSDSGSEQLIDISDLKTGLYLLKIKINSMIFIDKLIINKTSTP